MFSSFSEILKLPEDCWFGPAEATKTNQSKIKQNYPQIKKLQPSNPKTRELTFLLLLLQEVFRNLCRWNIRYKNTGCFLQGSWYFPSSWCIDFCFLGFGVSNSDPTENQEQRKQKWTTHTHTHTHVYVCTPTLQVKAVTNTFYDICHTQLYQCFTQLHRPGISEHFS